MLCLELTPASDYYRSRCATSVDRKQNRHFKLGSLSKLRILVALHRAVNLYQFHIHDPRLLNCSQPFSLDGKTTGTFLSIGIYAAKAANSVPVHSNSFMRVEFFMRLVRALLCAYPVIPK